MDRTIYSVIQSCYFGKDSLSSSYISRWLETNCPRLVSPLHKYCVHTLTTKWRELEKNKKDINQSATNASDELGTNESDAGQQKIMNNPLFDLATPILEKGITFGGGGTSSTTAASDDANIIVDRKLLDEIGEETLLPVSQAWLLAASLPLIYSKTDVQKGPLTKLRSAAVPLHWTLLYNSHEHGVGANRFLHHVLAYRGPTLVLLASNEDAVYCIASTTEWRETHLYTGSPESCVLQLLPKY